MPVATEVELCNRALREIGEEQLASLNDEGKAGETLRLKYPEVRDRLLGNARWTFALKRLNPTGTVATNLTGYTYQFSLVADPPMVRLVEVNDPTTGRPLGLPYIVENDILYCDSTGIQVLYIERETDVTRYPEHFLNALKYQLAAEIAYPIEGRDRNKLDALAEVALNEAIKHNAWAAGPRRRPSNRWVNARHER